MAYIDNYTEYTVDTKSKLNPCKILKSVGGAIVGIVSIFCTIWGAMGNFTGSDPSPTPTMAPHSPFGNGTLANYCGMDWSDAFKCGTPCPSGLDGECSSGEHCYAKISCGTVSPASSPSITQQPTSASVDSSYCGTDWTDASKCGTPCPSGVDSECSSGETCYANVDCGTTFPTLSPTMTQQPMSTGTVANYCGTDWADALTCGTPCPSGDNSACGYGEYCHADVDCGTTYRMSSLTMTNVPTSGMTTKYCGKDFSDAFKCGTPCPNGDSECGDGEYCYDDVDCQAIDGTETPYDVGTCGGGHVGNGICPDSSMCCSAWGYCGTSIDHCGSNRNLRGNTRSSDKGIEVDG